MSGLAFIGSKPISLIVPTSILCHDAPLVFNPYKSAHPKSYDVPARFLECEVSYQQTCNVNNHSLTLYWSHLARCPRCPNRSTVAHVLHSMHTVLVLYWYATVAPHWVLWSIPLGFPNKSSFMNWVLQFSISAPDEPCDAMQGFPTKPMIFLLIFRQA